MANDYFEKCFQLAEKSPCKKMKFGSVIILDKKIIGQGYNHPVHKCVEYLCNPCIRESEDISSGTRVELCSAVHAEQDAIFDARLGINDLSSSRLYIAGFYADGEKFIKQEKGFYCSFCSRIIARVGINDIRILTTKGEESLNIEELLASSYEYALGRKRIKK